MTENKKKEVELMEKIKDKIGEEVDTLLCEHLVKIMEWLAESPKKTASISFNVTIDASERGQTTIKTKLGSSQKLTADTELVIDDEDFDPDPAQGKLAPVEAAAKGRKPKRKPEASE